MSVTASYAGATVRPAGFWIRVLATLVDTLIIVIVQLVVAFAFAMWQGGGAEAATGGGVMAQAVGWVFGLAYYIGFTAVKGATPGKTALGLRVKRADGEEPVGFGTAFMREVIGKLVSSIVLLLGYLMVGFRADKRGLHDMIARTSVVKAG